jgi:hypothetical protein
MSFFVEQCLREFVDLVSNGMVLEPEVLETVVEKQVRPQQKLSLARAMVSGPFLKNVLKCFIKAEAYSGPKDPRIISQYNDSDKLLMSQFALALSRHVKQFRWYGPGKTPLEVAKTVAEICLTAESVNVSDYHRADGTISQLLRLVDRGVFMKTFVNHRTVLNELLNRNRGNTGYLPCGTKFDQDEAHGSGCAATSLSQTLRCTFNSYLAYRHTTNPLTGEQYSPAEAFAKLGIHSGDDGLDPDLPLESLEWASKKTGLVLEAAEVLRGHAGVSFLARYYSSEVWFGRTDSMCDVKRQLSKFHTSVRLPDNVLPEYKLVEKAMSYLCTDANTPVIGVFCKKVLALSSYRPKQKLGVAHWWSQFDGSVQFPNNNADGWMDSEFDRLFPEFDHSIFDSWVVGVRTATELLDAPLCAEPKPPTRADVAYAVDGLVYDGGESDISVSVSSGQSAVSTSSRKSAPPRRKRKKAKSNPGKRGSSEP